MVKKYSNVLRQSTPRFFGIDCHIYTIEYLEIFLRYHTWDINSLKRIQRHVREEEGGDLTTALEETGANALDNTADMIVNT